MHPSKTCFINAGLGQWYSSGSDRLKGSLIAHGFEGDVLIWKDDWPDNRFPRDSVYTVKAACAAEALRRGYEVIIWGDCSITARKNTAPFVEHIREHGYWIGQSGYNCAQTASDAQLQYFGVSRDWAEQIHDCASGLFGFDCRRPEMRAVLETWIQAGRDGAFHGSRLHAGQSNDHRFKFCRQDQSAMSLALGKAGLPLKHFISMARFKWDKQDTVFHCEGM
jgi:hypothetical protein